MAADADALAADIICSLRGADLAGWTPPWCKPPPTSGEGEMIWPAVARGKRSRRRSPVAAAGGKGRWARDSPASPLDYSGGSGSGSGSGSGASTSGGEDGGFFSPGHLRAGPAPTTKVGSIGRPHLAFPAPPPRPTGQRPRKKMRLPEVQQLVRSLTVENKSLREEMRALQRACTTLSIENDKLERRSEQSNPVNETASKKQKGKQQLDQQSVTQPPQGSFALPDLNLPAHDVADGSVHSAPQISAALLTK